MSTDQLCMRNSMGHNSFKNNSSVTRRQYAQLGLVSIILVKLYWIVTKGCWEIVFTRNVYRLTMYEKFKKNSFKNNSSATRRQYAQLCLVSIILVKLYWILTKGCCDMVFTRNVQTNRPTDHQARLLYSPHILPIWGYKINMFRLPKKKAMWWMRTR